MAPITALAQVRSTMPLLNPCDGGAAAVTVAPHRGQNVDSGWTTLWQCGQTLTTRA
jgi:hypothetical protein